MKDKKWNIFADGEVILLTIVFIVISAIAGYFQIKELYPIFYPLVGMTYYWLIKLHQHVKNKISYTSYKISGV